MSINEPYSRAESGITYLWDGIDCFGFLFTIATEGLNEEDTRIDWDAQPTATLDVTPPHYCTEKEISAVSVLLSSKWNKGKIL